MTDDIVLKTIPLPLALPPGGRRGTRAERAARVQAHMDRIHPVLDFIEQEERRVNGEIGDPVDRNRRNSCRSHRKRRAMARAAASERAAVVRARRA